MALASTETTSGARAPGAPSEEEISRGDRWATSAIIGPSNATHTTAAPIAEAAPEALRSVETTGGAVWDRLRAGELVADLLGGGRGVTDEAGSHEAVAASPELVSARCREQVGDEG